MKKKILVLSGVLFFCLPVFGQMVDMLSNLAIQGQMDAQSAKQLKAGFSSIKQNDIINKINLILLDAATVENKQTIQKSMFSHDLFPLDWDIQAINSQNFALILKKIDKPFCMRLISSFNYQGLFINGISKNLCDETNIIKFIF